jgi:glucose/arabinose dehydrogenase
MKRIMFAVFCALIILAFACGQPPPGRGAGEVESTSLESEQSQGQTAGQVPVKFRVETVVGGLEVPWSIVWAPDGRMIFTERPGRVRIVQNGKLRPQPLFVVPDVEPRGEAGLMGLALHPQFASNHWLYLSYVYRGDGQRVRVVR